MTTRLLHVWILLCLGGSILVATGCFLYGNDLSLLAMFVGQAGTANPRLLEKLRLIPTLLLVTGMECLLMGAVGVLKSRSSSHASSGSFNLAARSFTLLLLLAGWLTISALTLNFGAINLVNRLTRGLSPAEQIAADFGEDYRVVRAVRETTAESAAILIKTQRPLQFLLNYDLYPRKFYFYSDRSLPISSIPEGWMNRRRISWTLEISDTTPLQFELLPRKASF